LTELFQMYLLFIYNKINSNILPKKQKKKKRKEKERVKHVLIKQVKHFCCFDREKRNIRRVKGAKNWKIRPEGTNIIS